MRVSVGRGTVTMLCVWVNAFATSLAPCGDAAEAFHGLDIFKDAL
jgi:hypothetical protein